MIQKTAIVTGAGKGIGHACAKRFLSQGMNVVVAEKDSSLKKAYDEDHRVLFIETDVRDESQVTHMIQQTMKRFGRIDILINNAGLLIGEDRISPDRLSLAQWKEFIDTNLTGAFLCCKYAIPYLKKQKGSIINIASTRAFQSVPNTEAYSASKGGLFALTHALSISLGPDIRVNCISPGWIHTKPQPLKEKDHRQHPVGRVGKVEDIAAMASFLISDEASFITGQNFIVDGGMTKKMIYEE